MKSNVISFTIGAMLASTFNSTIHSATEKVNDLDGNVKELGKTFKDPGTWAGLGAGLLSMDTLFQPFKTAIDFEQSMMNVKSVINSATSEDLSQLTDEAKRLGAATSFSASEAAEGMKYLAMAGFKTNEIIAAMPGLLDMAKAGCVGLGEASDIASNILSAFGLQASEMNKVADVLTMAFTTSNTTLEGLSYTMKYVAPVGRELGLTLEDTAAMAGLLGNIGIQGEQAGTQLRALATRLINMPKEAANAMSSLGVSFADSEGNMKSVISILAELDEKTKDMGNADRMGLFAKVFGVEALSGISELISQEGAGGISKYIEVIKNSSGKASAVAADQMDTVAGSLDELSSAAEGLAISFGTLFLPVIRVAINLLTSITRGVDRLVTDFPILSAVVSAAVMGLVSFSTIVKGASLVFGFFSSAFIEAVKTFKFFQQLLLSTTVRSAACTVAFQAKRMAIIALNGAVKMFTVVWKVLNTVFRMSPIGVLITGLMLVGGLVLKLTGGFDGLKEKFLSVVEFISPLFDKIKSIWSFIFGEDDKSADINLNSDAGQAVLNSTTAPSSLPEPLRQINNTSTSSINSNRSVNSLAYSPNIVIQGNADKAHVQAAIDEGRYDFEKQYYAMMERKGRLSYAGA